ncbi:hypothetical protein STCU_05580 [Strigomonas culicis]|uniref:BTB domain-containing protein n=1 Tax=Strigomonas culicis TaxID=28005 RepID=S9UFR6_9TRYP|nr:hypothetical protein STCU_05580 [Strigomonas culicis]|eukprot:EPY27758.1 hypothetical protein STCU_05580 [Strigomonas culicis]
MDSDEEAGAASVAREVNDSLQESTPVFERQIGHVTSSLKKTRNALCKLHSGVPEVVTLKVGDQVFSAQRSLFEKDPQSLLFILVCQSYAAHDTDKKNRPLKRTKPEETKSQPSVEVPERDPIIFAMLLNMLRGYDNAVPPEWKEACWKEAVYYGLTTSWYERYGNRRPYAFQILACKRKLLSEAVYGVASEYFTSGEHYIDFYVVKWDRVALGVISSDADIESREDPLDTFGCAFYWNDGRISSFFSSLVMFNSSVVLNEAHFVRVVLDASENTVKWMWDEVTTIAMLRLPKGKTFAFCTLCWHNSQVNIMN